MGNQDRINQIVAVLDKWDSLQNTGQKSVYLKAGVAALQRRDNNNYMAYIFDGRESILGLDIRDAKKFQRFTKDDLIKFLDEELVEW